MKPIYAKKISRVYELISQIGEVASSYGDTFSRKPGKKATYEIEEILNELSEAISLFNMKFTEDGIARLQGVLNFGHPSYDDVFNGVKNICERLEDEWKHIPFFYVESIRAGWYGKKAVDIAKELWCSRFPSTLSEIEEASRCYALDRYTAAAFHLMRATEKGTKALGIAVGLTPKHPGWKLVFEEVYAQFKNHKPRHAVWKTHSAQLVKISGDLRTISGVWRNDLAHFVDTYGEEDATEMFTLVPMFMRHLAGMIDENGTLYP